MRIVSVNIGRAESITHGKRTLVSGIRKRSEPGAVRISGEVVDGDTICDTEHHGGADQAVYAYSHEDYAWWSDELGKRVSPGTFGDNLTIQGLPTNLNVGDRLLIGDVVLEVTSPRIPCSTLAAQMQDSSFGMAFRRAERPGIYLRVLNEGMVRSGDAVTLVENPAPVVSILDLFRLAYDLRPDAGTLQKYLDAPIAERVKQSIGIKLASLQA